MGSTGGGSRYCGCGCGVASPGAGVAVCEIGVGASSGRDGAGVGVVAYQGVGEDAAGCESGVGFIVRTGDEDTGVGRGRAETGVTPECTAAGVCDTASIPPVCFFARPGGMQPDDPGEQPHPVLLP